MTSYRYYCLLRYGGQVPAQDGECLCLYPSDVAAVLSLAREEHQYLQPLAAAAPSPFAVFPSPAVGEWRSACEW